MSVTAKMKWRKGVVQAEAAEVDYDVQVLEHVDTHFEKLVKSGKLLCAGYLLSRYGKIFAHRSLGALRGWEEGDTANALQPDSIRPITSITKPLTALAVMKLVEMGLLSLEHRVSKYIKELDIEGYRAITLYQLLTHTSGLDADKNYFANPERWMRAILDQPFAHGSVAFNYSNAGFALLGEVITRVSGVHYQEFVKQYLLDALDMKDTYFQVPAAERDRVCLVTREEQDKMLAAVSQAPDMPPGSEGGLYSTLPDLWKVGQLLLQKGRYDGRRVIGKKSVELMVREKLGIFSVEGGKSLLSPQSFFHHGGGWTVLKIDPAEEFVAVYFVPTSHGYVDESLFPAANVIWSGITGGNGT
ncbi:serine hydrolase domain-containing protein [Paenibacillus mesophilus]|uniref:serine hydrolase domain-containing protein n=1 Tax=Paenibacillus mesophilus TaxID=2582849 RepID=UPI001305209D|nr:serine hydrolase domain-containing protein [Paenibacillus mesophilus]